MKNLLNFGCRCLINDYWYRVAVLHIFNISLTLKYPLMIVGHLYPCWYKLKPGPQTENGFEVNRDSDEWVSTPRISAPEPRSNVSRATPYLGPLK